MISLKQTNQGGGIMTLRVHSQNVVTRLGENGLMLCVVTGRAGVKRVFFDWGFVLPPHLTDLIRTI